MNLNTPNFKARLLSGKRLIPIVAAIVSILATLVLTQFVSRMLALENQKSMSAHILTQAERVAGELSKAQQTAASSPYPECTVDDIDLMRRLTLEYELVQDIGRVWHGKIICTAGWGILKHAAVLPNTGYYSRPEKRTFYRNAVDMLPVRKTNDLIVKGNTVIFASPVNIKLQYMSELMLDWRLITRNGAYVFDTSSPPSTGVHQSWLSLFTQSSEQNICSQQFDLCIETTTHSNALAGLPSGVLLLLVTLGAGAGYLAGFALMAWVGRINSIDARLKKAVYYRALHLEYQPQYRLSDESIVGAEVLVRWQDDVYGNVSPEFFIKLAERMGIYRQITRFVIEQSLADMAGFIAKHPDFTLSINVGKHDIADATFLPYLNSLVESAGCKRCQIKMEITEKTDINYKVIAESARELRRLGYLVSLDDFGTGVANIHWLTEITFDEIKLDKYFVRGLGDDFKKAMLDALLSIIVPLNKTIVFEGIETLEEKNIVMSAHATAIGQGWYYSRAIPIKDFTRLYHGENQD
ncbi:EAL domain-containing protein [Mangrovibacter yixingensis]|uniref:EAL domain-containing protein n=1 Tax=Mangrovibacter yixingensis TaxID=1529639 RepID=UPI001CF9B973|nr:EAL domain-containing protein [Mangrovibacter yixingensis]